MLNLRCVVYTTFSTNMIFQFTSTEQFICLADQPLTPVVWLCLCECLALPQNNIQHVFVGVWIANLGSAGQGRGNAMCDSILSDRWHLSFTYSQSIFSYSLRAVFPNLGSAKYRQKPREKSWDKYIKMLKYREISKYLLKHHWNVCHIQSKPYIDIGCELYFDFIFWYKKIIIIKRQEKCLDILKNVSSLTHTYTLQHFTNKVSYNNLTVTELRSPLTNFSGQQTLAKVEVPQDVKRRLGNTDIERQYLPVHNKPNI